MDPRIPGAGILHFDYAEYYRQQQALDAVLARQNQQPATAAPVDTLPRRRLPCGDVPRRTPSRRSKAEDSADALKPLKVKSLPKPYNVDTWAEHGSGNEKRQEAAARVRKAKDMGGRDIDLGDLGLQSVHPQLLPNTTQSLSLSKNDLVALPSEVTGLPDLYSLNVGVNRIRALPENIGRLSKLCDLDLSHNKLSSLPESFSGLRSLLGLRLDHNKLQALPTDFALLDKLQVLSVSNNMLTGVNALPPQMGILKELRELNLSNNQIESVPEVWNEMFKTLRRANLSSNHLVGLPESFGIPPKSLSLNLANNPSIGTLPKEYGGFTYANLEAPFGMKPEWNDSIVSQRGKIKVNTANTKIRQGLVNEARLEDGRGVRPERYYSKSEQLPPNRIFGNELDDVYSVHDYIEDQMEPGQVVGLNPGQMGVVPGGMRADAFGAGAAPDGALGGAVGGNRMDSWLYEQANNYANKLKAPELVPQYKQTEAWDTLWPQMAQQPEMPAPNMFAPGPALLSQGTMPPAGQGMDPMLLQALQHELQQLPYVLPFLPPEMQQSLTPLLHLPPEAMLAQLMGMQGQPGIGAFPGAYGGHPLGPVAFPMQGTAPGFGQAGMMAAPPPYPTPPQPNGGQQRASSFEASVGPSGHAGQPPSFSPPVASSSRAHPSSGGGLSGSSRAGVSASDPAAGAPARAASDTAVNTNWLPAKARAKAAGDVARQAGSGVVGKLKATASHLWRPAEEYKTAEALSRMSIGDAPTLHAQSSTADMSGSWPQSIVPPAPRQAPEPEPASNGWLSGLRWPRKARHGDIEAP